MSCSLSSGATMWRMPSRWAASAFSFSPPIGSTSPWSVTSPVIATSCLTGMPVITETMAVAMAMPADGPSLGVAPSGTWTWMSRVSNSGGLMPNSVALERT